MYRILCEATFNVEPFISAEGKWMWWEVEKRCHFLLFSHCGYCGRKPLSRKSFRTPCPRWCFWSVDGMRQWWNQFGGGLTCVGFKFLRSCCLHMLDNTEYVCGLGIWVACQWTWEREDIPDNTLLGYFSSMAVGRCSNKQPSVGVPVV